jgi:membrane protease YdiL (CAAX protease family)
MEILKIIKQTTTEVTADDILYVIGVAFLGIWLLKTAFGTKALVYSPVRRNKMPFYLPLVPFLIWFIFAPAAMAVKERLFPNLLDWQQVLADNAIISASAIAAMTITLFLVRKYFVRGLKGFGLNHRSIPADFFAAIVNLISIYPLVLLAIVMTLYIGQIIWGPEFELAQHEELKSLIQYSQPYTRAMIIITAVAIAPVFEEFLFRGLFQTLIRSYLNRPWPGIFISAILFASAHANSSHWPALFFLGICLGYSYEKSGSLYRPIFIHALFNSASIISVLHST